MAIDAGARQGRRRAREAQVRAEKRIVACLLCIVILIGGVGIAVKSGVPDKARQSIEQVVQNPKSLLEFLDLSGKNGSAGKAGEVIPARNSAADSGNLNGKGDASASKEENWKLLLVNQWNPLPEDYEVNLQRLRNGQAVDERIYPELQQMFDEARAAGLDPEISSSYRTTEEQRRIMNDTIVKYRSEGYSERGAKEEAEKWVALPGTSEHELGLAVDITADNNWYGEKDAVWKWLNENCYKYGFILRYPDDKVKITGIAHEQWHYRYVGKEAAKEIYESGVCLEEYLGKK